MRSKRLIADFTLGDSLCFLMKGKDIIEVVIDMIRRKADVLLCTKNNCRPCTMARQNGSCS